MEGGGAYPTPHYTDPARDVLLTLHRVVGPGSGRW